MLRRIYTQATAAFVLIAALLSTGCTGSRESEQTSKSEPTEDSAESRFGPTASSILSSRSPSSSVKSNALIEQNQRFLW
jgi:hypothetical protein